MGSGSGTGTGSGVGSWNTYQGMQMQIGILRVVRNDGGRVSRALDASTFDGWK